MKRVAALALIICICLSGCSAVTGGEHIWTQIHSIPKSPGNNQNISVDHYDELYQALVDLVAAGTSQVTISVEHYYRDAIETDIQAAIEAVCSQDPIAAYAVDHIDFTKGTSGGEMVLALEIHYFRDQAQIKRIDRVADHTEANVVITSALVACETGVVMLMDQYEKRDIAQFVEDYAQAYPELVMETPQVIVNVYPDEGRSRVVEVRFTYQNSRENLKSMQTQVDNLFKSAQFFCSGYRTDERRLMRLYTWLMETSEYTMQTSITPAYSLLQYATGDSRAFATVYAALCRRMELECMTVTGTKDGESRCWNLVCIDGEYYHLDLLQCSSDGGFAVYRDSEMNGYVWDYNAYPNSPDPESIPTEPPATETPE